MVRQAARALAIALSLAAPAGAYTPAELATAHALARDVGDDVRLLASDALAGRGSGTAGAALAEEVLIDELASIAAGLDASGTGRDAYRQEFELVRTNLLAWIPGGARADEFVIVGAHYDHLAPGTCTFLGDSICNGATDNAAGVAAVLAIGRALASLPQPPARSIVLALWDGEELGLLGSEHFVAHPLVPLADVAAYVNFDIQGANLAPSVRELSFAIGAESGGEALTTPLEQAVEAVALETKRLTLTFGQARSDYHPFWAEAVPIVFFSDATNACYHTSSDEVALVDFGKLARQAEIGLRLVLALAEAEERPVFEPLVALDTYADLEVLADFLARMLGDAHLLAWWYQTQLHDLEALARSRVEAGPAAFQPTDALEIAQSTLGIATAGFPCDPLLLPEPSAAGAAALAALAGLARWRRARPRATR